MGSGVSGLCWGGVWGGGRGCGRQWGWRWGVRDCCLEGVRLLLSTNARKECVCVCVCVWSRTQHVRVDGGAEGGREGRKREREAEVERDARGERRGRGRAAHGETPRVTGNRERCGRRTLRASRGCGVFRDLDPPIRAGLGLGLAPHVWIQPRLQPASVTLIVVPGAPVTPRPPKTTNRQFSPVPPRPDAPPVSQI